MSNQILNEIVVRLQTTVQQLEEFASGANDEEQRYARSLRDLVQRYIELGRKASLGSDRSEIKFVLGNISAIMKGAIDIGSSWEDERPEEWDFLSETTRLAQHAELSLIEDDIQST